MSDFRFVQTADGLNRIHSKNLNNVGILGSKAIRNKNGELVVNIKRAQSIFNSIPNPKKIFKSANLAEDCGENNGYRASIHFHSAIGTAIEKIVNSKLIRSSLEKAKKRCESIDKISIYYYLLALADQAEGNRESRDKNLQKYLKMSESVYPYQFYQYNFANRDDDIVQNRKYREAAKDALSSQKELSSVFKGPNKGARMRYNSVYGPGGENTYLPQPLALLGSNRFESFYGLIYDQPTKYFSILPSVTYGTESGIYTNIKIRKQLYESYDRRFMYGVSGGADEWKKINYTGRSLGKQVYEVSRATIEEDGYNFYIANGLTIRPFLPSFGFASEAKIVRLTNLDSTIMLSTAYAFWEWNRDSGLRGGYINNNLVAEFYFSSIFIGYNFDSEYISSGMGRTF